MTKIQSKNIKILISIIFIAIVLSILSIFCTPLCVGNASSRPTINYTIHYADGKVYNGVAYESEFVFSKTDTTSIYQNYSFVKSAVLESSTSSDNLRSIWNLSSYENNSTKILDSTYFSEKDNNNWAITLPSTEDNKFSLNIYYSLYEYQLSYHIGNKNNEEYIETYKYGQEISLYRTTRLGYNFDGWYDTYGNKFNATTITSNTDLYAKWIINEPFLANTNVKKTVEYGTSVELEVSNLFTNEVDYQFLWYFQEYDGIWSVYDKCKSQKLTLKDVDESGNWLVKVRYKDKMDSNWFELTGPIATINITPREVKISPVGAENLIYNGRMQTVGATLGNLVYGDNPIFAVKNNTQKEIGIYEATVYDLQSKNYKLPQNSTFTYIIKKPYLSYAPSQNGQPEVVILTKNGFMPTSSALLSYSNIKPKNLSLGFNRYIGTFGVAFYESQLVNNDFGTYTIKIKADKTTNTNTTYKAIFTENNNEVDAVVKNGYIVFTTDNYGEFLLIENAPIPWWIWFLIALFICFLLIGLIVFGIKFAKHRATKAIICSEKEIVNNDIAIKTDNTDKNDSLATIIEEIEPIDSPVATSNFKHDFELKMLDADTQIKIWYSDLKNLFLSYNGIKSRLSHTCDSFRRARTLYAKITLIGTTLRLSLALDPDKPEYNDGRFPHKNKGDKPSYKEVPFQVKIKTDLGYRRAVALIVDMMSANKIKKSASFEKIDYVKTYTKK